MSAPESTPPSEPQPSVQPAGTIEDERSPWLTNLVLLALVAGLGLWVWLGEGQTPPPPPEANHEIFPLGTAHEFNPFQAVGLELVRGEETLRLTRTPSQAEQEGQATKTEEGHTAPVGWQFTAPRPDRGDDTQLFRLLNRVQHARWRLTLEDASKLGQPTVVARIERKPGFPTLTLRFGTPSGGQVALQVEETERPTRLYLVDEELHTEFSRPAWVWRRKVLFDVPLERVLAVRARTGEVTLGVARGPRGWRLGDAHGDVAERGPAEELIEAVRLLRGATIHGDEVPPAELARLGLAPTPWATLELDDAGEGGAEPRTWRLLLGGEVPERSGERYALLETRPEVVFTVQTSTLAERLAKDPSLYLSSKVFQVEAGVEAVTGLGAELAERGPVPSSRWKVELQDEGWRFAREPRPLASKPALDAVLADLLALRISERLSPADAKDLATLGLSEPRLRIELYEGTYRHVLEVGADGPGGTAVRRLLPNPTAGEPPLAFVYRVGLGDLPDRLGDGFLGLLDPKVYSASSWDARRVELSDQDGKVLFRASFDPLDPAQPQGPREWTFPDHPRADAERFKAYLKTFDELHAQRYVAERATANLGDYGLDRPEKLTIWVNSFADGQRTQVPQELWIGARAGEAVYVTTPAGVAIALVDYRFRERIDDAFEKGEALWTVSPFDVRGVKVYRDGLLALELTRPDANWLWSAGGASGLLPPSEVRRLERKLLDDEVLGRVVLGRARALEGVDLAQLGLAHPRLRVELLVQPLGGAAPETHVLLIGAPTGGASSWAMRAGGQVYGSYKGTRALQAFLDEAEPPPPFPPRPR